MKTCIGVALVWGVLLGIVFSDKSCDDILKQNVIPNYADIIRSSDITVCYDVTNIHCEEDYAPALLESKPTIYFDVGKSCSYTTIVFFGQSPDSDALNLLWAVYNVQAEALRKGFSGRNNERIRYTKPKTFEGTSAHYFFIYCQDDYLRNLNCCTQEERNNFSPKDFAESNKLKEVVGALYFRVVATGEVMKAADTKKDNFCTRN